MKLSNRQKEALELLKYEEFYLVEFDYWNFWSAYNTNKHIRTDTMKALKTRGLVKVEYGPFKEGAAIAKITEQGRLVKVQ